MRLKDYLPAAKISEGTKAEYLRDWARIVAVVGWDRFDVAIDQVKRNVTDEEGNITPRKAYQFPTPEEIRAAVPPMYLDREHVRVGQVSCQKCQDTHWVTRMFEEQVPGFGANMVPRATRCDCWEAYRVRRTQQPAQP